MRGAVPRAPTFQGDSGRLAICLDVLRSKNVVAWAQWAVSSRTFLPFHSSFLKTKKAEQKSARFPEVVYRAEDMTGNLGEVALKAGTRDSLGRGASQGVRPGCPDWPFAGPSFGLHFGWTPRPKGCPDLGLQRLAHGHCWDD